MDRIDMSLYNLDVCRMDGRIRAFVEIQDDYSGTTQCQIREIHDDCGVKYIRCEGRRVDVTHKYNNLIDYENKVKHAFEVAKKVEGWA